MDRLVADLERRIDARVWRPGTRVPSIRAAAEDHGVSRFTVVAAYDRLVATGRLESRRGSGFYVREAAAPSPRARREPARGGAMDVAWLLRNMFGQLPAERMPGSGLPPAEWLDADLISAQLRAVGRQKGSRFVDYGVPQGFLPLRTQLSQKLAAAEIEAPPEQIVLTAGATQALDLVARLVLAPGDAVLVDDPAWFLMFGLFAAQGARVVGVPRAADGPDLAALEALIAQHRPRLYVLQSVLHNPTSTSLSAAKAYRVLTLARAHGITVVEDDVYGDLHPGPVARLAQLDQLEHVILIGSFSKTLSANLRVGFAAASPETAARLADLKMLTTLTSPEVNERVVYRVLSEGHYRKHVERLRDRLARARPLALRALERVGLVVPHEPAAGMFLWARARDPERLPDSNRLVDPMLEAGYLIAPGGLFSPEQKPSPWIRFNVATAADAPMLAALGRALNRAGPTPAGP